MTTCPRFATSSWPRSSTRSRTCWRSRASCRSRSAPTGGRPIPSPTAPVDIVAAYRAGTPPRLEGVGKAIDEKLAELADTGRLRYHEQLLAQVPPSLVTLLSVPGIGPRTAGDLWRELGIATLADLEVAAREGRLRDGQGHLRQDRAAHPRRPCGAGGAPAVTDAHGRGARRGRSPRDAHRDVSRRHERDRWRVGPTGPRDGRRPGPAGRDGPPGRRADRRPDDGRRGAGRGRPPGRRAPGVGAAAARTAGGRDDVSRRVVAARTWSTSRGRRPTTSGSGSGPGTCGWSLSEHGFARLGPDGAVLTGDAAEVRTFATEAEVYDFLGLPFIEPELREDRGEIEAALAGRLPRLVTRRRPPGRLPHATPSGRTARSRSRPWPRRHGGGATPTRC